MNTFIRGVQRSLSLGTVVAATFGLMAVIAIASLGIYAERSFTREENESVQERLASTARHTRLRLDYNMFERFREIQIVSSLEVFRSGNVNAMRSLLERLKDSFNDYAWIGFADGSGNVLASTGAMLEGADVSQRPWFTEGLHRSFAGDVHEAVLLADKLPNPERGTLRFVDVSAPVLGADDTVVGVIGAHLYWSWAKDLIESLARQAADKEALEIFVLDRNNKVLLGPGGGFGRPLPCRSQSLISSASVETTTLSCDDGQTYVAAMDATAGHRFYPGLGWKVLVRQPTEVALASITTLRESLYFATAGIAIAFMVIGWILAAWIVRPLSDITGAAEQMRMNEWVGGFPSSNRFAEVSSLARSLASLIAALTQTKGDLASNIFESERRARLQAAIIENMQDALFVSKNGKIALVNRSFSRNLANGRKDPIGYSVQEIFDAESRMVVDENIRKLQDSTISSTEFEARIVRRDDNIRDVEVTVVKFFDQKEDALLFILRDVTEHKLTERKLVHMQKMESLGQLTGGIAHDFNNMLAIIVGSLQLLERQLENEPRALKFTNMALKASHSGTELIKQLLAFSRRQVLDPQVFQLNALVSQMTDLLRSTLGQEIDIRMELADDIWPVVSDPAQMESVIANLAINSRDAMPDGGVLTIRTENKHLDEQYTRQYPDVQPGDYVVLAVTDSGTGIPPELLDRIIEPFYTTKKEGKGTGLGLSMVYGFIKQSRGHFSIYSEVGHGTSVHLYLPRALMGNEISDGRRLPKPSRDAVDARILVAEDNIEVREIAVELLQDLGYDVIEAEDAESALAIIRSDPTIDLLFTDIVMPGGRTGIQLAKEALNFRVDLKVLFTSGFASVLNGKEQSHPPGSTFINKPYTQESLDLKIREALAKGIDRNV